MESLFSHEQRKKYRKRIEFPLKIITINNGGIGDETHYGKAIDVSENGIGLVTTQPITSRADLLCIVNFGENEAPEWLICTVAWHLKCENTNRYGLQLRQKREGTYQAFLEKLLIHYSRIKSTIPKEGQFISDEAILKIDRYLNTSDIKLNQIKMLDNSYVHKIDHEQVWISDVQNVDEYAWEIDELRNYTVFRSYAYPNLKCPVCFDHALDHFPMMSLFEMTRQMGLAIMHQFYQVPMKGYISIVQKMSFDYRVFAELDFPLAVYLVDICEPSFVDKVQNRIVELFFLQENVICAHVLGEMSAIKSELYSRIRKSARKSRLINKFGTTGEVTFVTNKDAAFLYAPRNSLQYNPINQTITSQESFK
jgi:hypothetical protein